MKIVILAGGYGTRISEESDLKPKPMLEIGNKPILWHIMKTYSYYGFNEFIICAGYKQHIIKQWFADYYIYNSDITFDFSQGNKMVIHNNVSEPWVVTVIDTGLNTMTGGRVKRVKDYIGDETFMLTYGDGVADINIGELYKFHKEHGKLATMTAVRPEGRFGVMEIENNYISSFREKSQSDCDWINGGFMVLEPEVINYIRDDTIVLEKEPMEHLSKAGELLCYKHKGFWQCMDTLRDKKKLEAMWAGGNAPWKVWEN